MISLRKLTILLFLLCLPSCGLSGQRAAPIQVQFDERVELVSVVFYLAGNKEYAECNDSAYLKAVEQYFGSRRTHPAVKMAADLRERKHVWFGSPVSLAIHLTPDFELAPGTRAQADGGSLDFRWTLAEAQAFAQQVHSFAQASRAPRFFQQHRPLYRSLTGRLEQLTGKLRPEWFAGLSPAEDSRQFTVVPSLLAGNGNYGPHAQTATGVRNYAIVGVWRFEPDGSPAFGDDAQRIIVHEFAHAYVNPWVDAGMALLRPDGETLIKAKQSDFEKTGYGQGIEFNPDILYETMVRALVVMYLADQGDNAGAQRQLQHDVQEGWTWLPAVVDWAKAARVNASFRLDEALRRSYGELLTALAR
jgi:hypothetical protein